MKKFLDLIHKIRFRIVIIFIILMSAASLTIIVFNYKENQKAVRETSLITTRQIGRGIVQNLNGKINSIQMITSATTSLVRTEDDISSSNDYLIDYLKNVLFQNPLIASIRICSANGDFISVNNLSLTKQSFYRFDISKKLPQGTKYAISTILFSKNKNEETWKYLDPDLVLLGSEQNSPPSKDPRMSLWYRDVSIWPRLAWSSPYNISQGARGISFSSPIISNGKVIAVVAADLALDSLSTLIEDAAVGKTGQTFIISDSGEILLPLTIQGPLPFIIEKGYNLYKQSGLKNFILDQNDTSYVLEIFQFPLDISTRWLLITAVPFTDFFGSILESEIDSIKIGLFVLIVCSLLIYWASGKIAKPINQLAEDVKKIQNFDFGESNIIDSNIYEITLLNYSIETMRKTFSSFSKYVPKDIVKKLLQLEHKIVIGGERQPMTILFSDIENFTTIAESLPVEEVNIDLTEYFEAFTKIIVQNEGTIDKYIGDSVMAIWNAPIEVPNHATKACLACLNFIVITKNTNARNPFFKTTTRFGINTGEVIVGNIGTTERISYTAIGTVVNTASRFQTLNKTYNTRIIIGETVRESIPSNFITRPLDLLAVKGRKQPVQIYELMGLSDGEPEKLILPPEQLELSNEFTKAFNLFHKGDLSEAKKIFIKLSKLFPEDEPTKIYLNRLN